MAGWPGATAHTDSKRRVATWIGARRPRRGHSPEHAAQAPANMWRRSSAERRIKLRTGARPWLLRPVRPLARRVEWRWRASCAEISIAWVCRCRSHTCESDPACSVLQMEPSVAVPRRRVSRIRGTRPDPAVDRYDLVRGEAAEAICSWQRCGPDLRADRVELVLCMQIEGRAPADEVILLAENSMPPPRRGRGGDNGNDDRQQYCEPSVVASSGHASNLPTPPQLSASLGRPRSITTQA